MRTFLAAAAALLAYAAEDDKRCLADSLLDTSKKTFDACSLNSKIDALEAALSSVSARRAVVVKYKADAFVFSTDTVDAAYEALLKETVAEMTPGMDLEKHTIHYYMQLTGEGYDVTMTIKDDASLARALAASREFGVPPVFTAHKQTPNPTQAPTQEPTDQPTNAPTNLPTAPPTPESYSGCAQVKARIPNAQSGVYKLNTGSVDYDTFCDMETSGGPYTLVAAIHEDDINSYCTAGDRWSRSTGGGQRDSEPSGDGSWQNKKTFGSVNIAGNNDFKNPGYWELTTSKLLINLLDQTANPSEFISKTWLGRVTTTDFLKAMSPKNLYGFYTKYPVTYNTGNGGEVRHKENVQTVRGNSQTLKTYSAPNCNANANQIGLTAFNCEKGANAFCLSVCGNCHSEHSCIGGGGYWPGHGQRLCNDYGGFSWDAIVQDRGNGWSSAQKLISSVTHIYYQA